MIGDVALRPLGADVSLEPSFIVSSRDCSRIAALPILPRRAKHLPRYKQLAAQDQLGPLAHYQEARKDTQSQRGMVRSVRMVDQWPIVEDVDRAAPN